MKSSQFNKVRAFSMVENSGYLPPEDLQQCEWPEQIVEDLCVWAARIRKIGRILTKVVLAIGLIVDIFATIYYLKNISGSSYLVGLYVVSWFKMLGIVSLIAAVWAFGIYISSQIGALLLESRARNTHSLTVMTKLTEWQMTQEEQESEKNVDNAIEKSGDM